MLTIWNILGSKKTISQSANKNNLLLIVTSFKCDLEGKESIVKIIPKNKSKGKDLNVPQDSINWKQVKKTQYTAQLHVSMPRSKS